jgi:hypothetical protein
MTIFLLWRFWTQFPQPDKGLAWWERKTQGASMDLYRGKRYGPPKEQGTICERTHTVTHDKARGGSFSFSFYYDDFSINPIKSS